MARGTVGRLGRIGSAATAAAIDDGQAQATLRKTSRTASLLFESLAGGTRRPHPLVSYQAIEKSSRGNMANERASTNKGRDKALANTADVLAELAILAPGRSATNGQPVVAAPLLHALAKRIGRNHEVALGLWASGEHSARLLAGLVGDPSRLSEAEMEAWVAAIDSWDICDGCCCYLFDRTPFAYAKPAEWAARPEEFVKRAGFALMAYLAVHDKKATDAPFLAWLPIILRESTRTHAITSKTG